MIKKYKEYSENIISDLPDFPESQAEIMSLSRKYGLRGFSINEEDWTVDVYSNPNQMHKIINSGVMLTNSGLIYLPLKFGYVEGFFSCLNNKLVSLEGCPEYIGDFFSCAFNKLTSLEHGPQYVGGGYFCHRNSITSLKGCPSSIDGNFDCSHNKLTTLEGSPEYVSNAFDCTSNNLYTLEGAPREVGIFSINSSKDHNPVEEILRIFPKLEIINVMTLWDTFDPVKKQGEKWFVRSTRLKEFYLEITGEDFGGDLPNFKNYMICDD